MCDPGTIAGLVLTAGSTVANMIGQNQVKKAREDALGAERIRQRNLDQENEALNQVSRERYEDFGGQQEERGSKLADYFTGNEAAAADANERAVQQMLPTAGSDVTVREEAKQSGLAKAFTDQQGQALGQLRAFGDLLGGIGRKQARDASNIGQINAFKRGSSGIVPLELEQANEAGAGARMFGDLLGLGGSLALKSSLGKTTPGPNYFPPPPTLKYSGGGIW